MLTSSRVLFLICVSTLLACGKLQPLAPVAVDRTAMSKVPALPAIAPETLDGYQIENVMLLYFRDGMDTARWGEVFTGAARLAKRQKEQKEAFAARLLEDPEAEPDFESVGSILALIDDRLLSSVSNFSFWGSTQTDCWMRAQASSAAVDVACREGLSPDRMSPMPEPMLGPLVASPADLKRKIFLPYFSSRGQYAGPKGQFSFELQLRPEPINPKLPDSLVLKGDLLLDPGYRILDLQGGVAQAFRYGYAEITLRKPRSN